MVLLYYFKLSTLYVQENQTWAWWRYNKPDNLLLINWVWKQAQLTKLVIIPLRFLTLYTFHTCESTSFKGLFHKVGLNIIYYISIAETIYHHTHDCFTTFKAFATIKSYSKWDDVNTKGVKWTQKELAHVIGPGIGDNECQQWQQCVSEAASKLC